MKRMTLCILIALVGFLLLETAIAEGVCVHANTKLETDAVWHSIVCSDCGKQLWTENHFINCTEPGVCAYCRIACDSDDVRHGNTKLETDAVSHWITCYDCVQILWKEEHFTKCTEPGICVYCRIACAGSEMIHGENYHCNITEGTHVAVCDGCGQEIFEEEHYAWCDVPGKCGEYVCEAPYSGRNIRHKDFLLSIEFDETSHWYKCTFCGVRTASVAHFASAKNPNVCGACGAQMPGKGTLMQASDGKFYYCGQDGKVDTSFCHPAFVFEGGKFIIINGVLDTSVNGVTLMNGVDFYFYAGGQVQEVTQLAEYNGAWFLLDRGKVNQSYTGLYEYNGEMFLITGGQLRSDYSGVWDDPRLGEVEIVNGWVASVG